MNTGTFVLGILNGLIIGLVAVGFVLVLCSYLWLLSGLLNAMPRPERDQLQPTLPALGTVENAYPFGPVNFSSANPNQPWGRAFWRTVRYHKDCTCFRVEDQVFHPQVLR